MTYRQEAEVVLANWRDVERALHQAAHGSADAERLQAEALRLRDEYQRLVERAELAYDDDPPSVRMGDPQPDLTGST